MGAKYIHEIIQFNYITFFIHEIVQFNYVTFLKCMYYFLLKNYRSIMKIQEKYQNYQNNM